MDKQPKISICVPIHDMQNGDKFLWRLVNSLTSQTFKDWELIITKDGKMACNSNEAIKRARGELIKIMYLDDYFTESFVLQRIVDNFKDKDGWMILGANDNPTPYWTDDIETGNNHLGSPSALVFRNIEDISHGEMYYKWYFDEKMSWLLDVDLYRRMFNQLGLPKIITGDNI